MIIFSKKCHVEKDGCKRCLSKRDVAYLRMFAGWNLDVAHNSCWNAHFQRCETEKVGARHNHIPLPLLVFLRCCGSGECNTKTNWICQPQSLCSVSHSAKSPPQIPPKSHRYAALSHTYCSVAYPLKPANIRSLLQGPFCLPILWVPWNSQSVSLLLSPLPASLFVTVTASFFPLLALFLSFLLSRCDWMLNCINSDLSRVPSVWLCHHAFVLLPQRQISAHLLNKVHEVS